MATFFATMAYQLSPSTSDIAKQLLRAELVRRQWHDRYRESPMPDQTVWSMQACGPTETTDHVHQACSRDLENAIKQVEAKGYPISLQCIWVHVSGAGSYGLASL